MYHCVSLSEATDADMESVRTFSPVSASGEGLAWYLRHCAEDDERVGAMRTYLVRDTQSGELAGYFSLKAGLGIEREAVRDGKLTIDTLPVVELANFAMSGAYREAHPASRGLGRYVFRGLVLPTIRLAAEIVGVSWVAIYSLPIPKVIANYESYGFRRLSAGLEDAIHERIKPYYDQSCVFMYMPLG